jgi:hypothetical protein
LEDRRISATSVAEQLGISRERVGSIIHEDLDMLVCFLVGLRTYLHPCRLLQWSPVVSVSNLGMQALKTIKTNHYPRLYLLPRYPAMPDIVIIVREQRISCRILKNDLLYAESITPLAKRSLWSVPSLKQKRSRYWGPDINQSDFICKDKLHERTIPCIRQRCMLQMLTHR